MTSNNPYVLRLGQLIMQCFFTKFEDNDSEPPTNIRVDPYSQEIEIPFTYKIPVHDRALPKMLSWDSRIYSAALKFESCNLLEITHIKQVPLLLYINHNNHSFNLIIIPNSADNDSPEKNVSSIFGFGISNYKNIFIFPPDLVKFTCPHDYIYNIITSTPNKDYRISAIEPLTVEFLLRTLEFIRSHINFYVSNPINIQDKTETHLKRMTIHTDLKFSMILTNTILGLNNCASITASMSTRKNNTQSVISDIGCMNIPAVMRSQYYKTHHLNDFIRACVSPRTNDFAVKWILRVYQLMKEQNSSINSFTFWLSSFIRKKDEALGFGRKKTKTKNKYKYTKKGAKRGHIHV